jgi:pre-60S factor REI1
MPDIFTCVTCNVAFDNSDLQRDHYKTDWHRYNLKRKVAELPAVTAHDFNDRQKLQKEMVIIIKLFTSFESFSNK